MQFDLFLVLHNFISTHSALFQRDNKLLIFLVVLVVRINVLLILHILLVVHVPYAIAGFVSSFRGKVD